MEKSGLDMPTEQHDRLAPPFRVLDAGSRLLPVERVERWYAEGGFREVATRLVECAGGEGFDSLRVAPDGGDVTVTADGPGGRERMAAFPLPFRSRLVSAFNLLAGLPPSPDVFCEAVFPFDTEAGVVSTRISCVPGLSGPETVIKFFRPQSGAIPLGSVGMNREQVAMAEKLVETEGGLHLVSSPGPHGGATTLFALLRALPRPPARIVTVEERFRFRNEGVVQFERKGFESAFDGQWDTLADALNPGAVVVESVVDGAELRDLVEIASGGTAVFAGVREGTFGRALRRILSVPVDSFQLARTIRMVVHQRLVSLLCESCRRKVPARPTSRGVAPRHQAAIDSLLDSTDFFLPAGCPACKGTGFSGRMALVEMLPFTPSVEAIVSSDMPVDGKVERLLAEEFLSAAPTAMELVRCGAVLFEEAVPFFR